MSMVAAGPPCENPPLIAKTVTGPSGAHVEQPADSKPAASQHVRTAKVLRRMDPQ
jgi:hypothetical protein